MGLFSNNIKISDFKLQSTEPAYSNKSWTGAQIRRSTGIQYYQISFNLQFNQADRQEVLNFIAQYSQGRPFITDLGYYSQYTGNQFNTVSSTATVNKGGTVIPCNNNVLEVGTLVTFQNSTKIHRIIANTGTSITVFPALRQNVQAGEVIRYQGITGAFIIDVDCDLNLQSTNIISLQVKATEAL
ncbi:hypothetical protein M2354_000799 [Leclercia adecarboxylata]|uniref:hypothetical protein n=1 Tax=Leclercia adecarboxylata TaxID=83655 RepID=UPI002474A11E|nr:hypothetical protein [Leclercia adecarboxylata]MDH6161144.1 hypothetical protein [Leclercia adecarboxylata]